MSWLEACVCFAFKQTLQVKEKQVAKTNSAYTEENRMKNTSCMRHRQLFHKQLFLPLARKYSEWEQDFLCPQYWC